MNRRNAEHREGEPAPRTGLLRETIGPPECPLFDRWTLLNTRRGKLLLHHFLPNADDRHAHDHPASFITIVLRGGYADIVECLPCDGRGGPKVWDGRFGYPACRYCKGTGIAAEDRLHAGSIRFRSAEHTHRTRVGRRGCWTLVLMGRKRREWGFRALGNWWPWREYEKSFGFGARCPDD